MTMQQAKVILRAIGVSIRKDDGEYRVNIIGGTELTAYYTSDLEDAVATGKAMSKAPEGTPNGPKL